MKTSDFYTVDKLLAPTWQLAGFIVCLCVAAWNIKLMRRAGGFQDSYNIQAGSGETENLITNTGSKSRRGAVAGKQHLMSIEKVMS